MEQDSLPLNQLETRDTGAEFDGRTVTGLALPFHDAAEYTPGKYEIVEPGAVDTPAFVELRDGHDGPAVGVAEITETPQGYEMRAKVTQDSDRFRGRMLSVGFHAVKDPIVSGVRRLQAITLDHVAFVTNPAYSKARVVEVRHADTAQEGTPMDETTETTAVVETTPDELVELREQVAELTRRQEAAPVVQVTEQPLEVRAARNVRSAGEFLYWAHRALAPGEYASHEQGLALDRLGLSEAEIRQQVSSSADGPLPQPLLGPIEDLVRSGRPYANAIGSLPLPPNGMTIERPKVTQGTSGAWEASEGVDGGSQQYVTTPIVGRIKTWKSVNGVSLQAALRTSPSLVDGLLRDMAADAAQNLDGSVISGAGALNTPGGSIAGITANADIVSQTWVGATFDIATFWSNWSAAYKSVVNALNMPPQFVAFNPGMWADILGLLDASNRPVLAIDGRPTQNTVGGGGFGPGSTQGGAQAVGSIQMVPVIIDSNIGTDEFIVHGPGTFELYEGPQITEQLRSPVNFVTDYGRAFMACQLPIRPEGVVHVTAAPAPAALAQGAAKAKK